MKKYCLLEISNYEGVYEHNCLFFTEKGIALSYLHELIRVYETDISGNLEEYTITKREDWYCGYKEGRSSEDYYELELIKIV